MLPRWNVLQSLWILRSMLVSLTWCVPARRRQENLPLKHGFISSRISGSFMSLHSEIWSWPAHVLVKRWRKNSLQPQVWKSWTFINWLPEPTECISPRAASQLNLDTLAFSYTDAGSAGAFLKELEVNPPKSLTRLWIQRNNLGPQRGQVLPQLVQKLPNLVELSIQNNQLGDELGKKLATARQGSNLRLQDYQVRGNDFSKTLSKRCLDVEWFTWCDLKWRALCGKIKMVLMQLEGACMQPTGARAVENIHSPNYGDGKSYHLLGESFQSFPSLH